MYLTRHLECIVDHLPIGSRVVRKGDTFRATPIDADYYVRHKKAVDTVTPETATLAAPPVEVNTPVVQGVASEPAEPVGEVALGEASGDQATAEPETDQQAPRRGRRPASR